MPGGEPLTPASSAPRWRVEEPAAVLAAVLAAMLPAPLPNTILCAMPRLEAREADWLVATWCGGGSSLRGSPVAA